MRLVSEQSEQEIQQREALADLKIGLRQLAANLMRITRGAGASYRLPDQMAECLVAMRAYRDAAGCGVSSFDMDEMLDPEKAQEEHRPWTVRNEATLDRLSKNGDLDREDADREIRRACLQITASMLLDQLPQMRRGESDLTTAANRREDLREQRRARHAAELKAQAPKRKPKKGNPTFRL